MSGKHLLFFILMPIVIPLMLFLNATYEWWSNQAEKNKILFFILAPLYAFLSLILQEGIVGAYFKLAE